MRVITGSARGHRLQTLPGLDVRPTTDMVKEAMFSIIHFEIEGATVLDLFAGSGQLGIEALSRGAKYCVFVDSSREAQEVVRENLQSTGLSKLARVGSMDALAFVQNTNDRFDIAFLDPPYNKNIIDAILPILVGKMTESGVIICETDRNEKLPESAGEMKKYRDYRYGKTMLTVYRKEEQE